MPRKAIKKTNRRVKRTTKAVKTNASGSKKNVSRKIKLPKIKISLPSSSLRLLKKLLTITATLVILDGLIQFYYAKTVIAEGGDHYLIKKSTVVEHFLKSKYPTSVDQIVQMELAKQVVFKEARKKRITVTSQEIQQQLEEIKKNYGDEKNFQQALEAQGFTEKSFKELLKAQVLLKKLVEPQYKEPSEKELKDYFETKKSINPTYKDKKYEDIKEKVKEDYRNEKIAELENKWMQEHLTPVMKDLVLYTTTPYHYTLGGGFIRLPVIREIAPMLKEKINSLTQKKQEQTTQKTQNQNKPEEKQNQTQPAENTNKTNEANTNNK